MVEMRVEGLAELQAKLNKLKTTKAKRIMNRGLRAGGEVFKAAIEDRTPERTPAPSGTALPPGALKHDIGVKTLKGDEQSGIVLIGPGKHTKRVMGWLEFGHRQVRGGASVVLKNGKTRGKGRQVGFVPPHPIMRPAFEASEQAALDAFQASLRADLEKV